MMQVQGWKRLDVGDGLVAANFWTLLIYLFVCLTTRIVIKVVKRPPAPDFLRLSEKKVQSIQYLVTERDLLNKRQCLNLSSKVSETIQNIQKLVSHCGSFTDPLRSSLEYLSRILVRAKLLVKDCSREDWIAASAFHIQNENGFRVILLELGLCYHAISEQAKGIGGEGYFQVEDLRDTSTFEPASISDVDEDREELKKRLEDLVNQRESSRWLVPYQFVLERISKRLQIAQFLLVKLNWRLQQPDEDGPVELPEELVWTEKSYSFLSTWGRKVVLGDSQHSLVQVSKTSWLGIPCIKKCPISSKEAGISYYVNHPNVIKCICGGKGQEEGHYFISTELMEMSLYDLIQKQAKPFPLHVAVDIMVQIARGVCYLHGRRIAHRDLKPQNVVLNRLISPHIVSNYHLKLIDFGASKTEVKPHKSMSSRFGVGSYRYKAPEIRYLDPNNDPSDRKWRALWFKADVWSFAITCLDILSVDSPKIKTEDPTVFQDYIDKDEHVELIKFHIGCSDELIALLKECLQAKKVRSRPSFFKICSRLETLRHTLLRGLPTSDQGMKMDTEIHNFIEKELKEHFQRLGKIDDDEAEASMPRIPVIRRSEQGQFEEMTRGDQAFYYYIVRRTIRRAVDLVKSDTIEFNESLCERLAQELFNTEDFLNRRLVDLSGYEVQCESRRVVLVQLYSVVKQAETLMQKCCKNLDSPWPERVFMLLEIKENVLDIILHLWWWTSILDIVIVSTAATATSERVEAELLNSLTRANQDYETKLEHLTASNSELQKAAVKDRDFLLNRVVEFRRSNTGHEPGTREHRAYLLSIQMHSLLMDDEAIRTPELNEFEVREVIANIPHGVVSRVEWCGYDCAVKTVQNSNHNLQEKETRILKSFHHPHIVKYFCRIEGGGLKAKMEHEYWEDESYIVMERMPADLQDYITNKQKEKLELPFSESVAIDIMLQVAKAVWRIHSKNVVHMDLKTKNILVEPVPKDEDVPELSAEGFLRVKVADFGIAEENIMSSQTLLMTPRTGTSGYRSPELSKWEIVDGQRRSMINYPHKTDSWTFGITCAEILTGKPPSYGMNRMEVDSLVESGHRPWIPEDCPDYLKFCIESCWKYDPEDRPEFSDIWKMLRFAKLRSLGVIDKNFDLFWFKNGYDRIVELHTCPTSESDEYNQKS